MKPLALLFPALLAIPFLAGCEIEGGFACTEIGCHDAISLNVRLADDSEVHHFSGTVTIGEETIAVSCHPETAGGDRFSCQGSQLFLDGFTAQEISVDLQSDEDDSLRFEGTITLDAQEVYPNGEDCPPVCLQATETVVLVPTEEEGPQQPDWVEG